MIPKLFAVIVTLLVFATKIDSQINDTSKPIVQIETSLGSFSLELFSATAPVTVANFLNYVRDGDYDGSFIHRMVPGFVVQGGGYKLIDGMAETVPTDPPIINEFSISNTRGTVAMAKLSGDPNSATSQWFINLSDNSDNLDTQNGGFTVFGRVIGLGMDVVDGIASLPTGNFAPPFSEAPTINGNLVVLNKVSLVQLAGKSFKVVNRGGVSFSSKGTSTKIVTGFGRVEPDEGMTTPAGLAIFGFTQDGTLVSEAGVPASVTTYQGRLFAELNGSVTTGIAIANPNDNDATISFFFTGADGVNFGTGTLSLGPNKQTAKFLNEHPFNGISPLIGTFTFISDQPVSVIALRGLSNERSEFLITTLPVTPLVNNNAETLYFPHFADGAGWTTQVILVNPTDSTITGTVKFLDPGSSMNESKPIELKLDDARFGSEFPYAILPRTSIRMRTSNPPGATQVGSIRVIRDAGSSSPSGVAVFSLETNGVTVTEAGVPVSVKGSGFRLYVEAEGALVRSGVAITNTSNTATMVSFELTNLDGTTTGLTSSLTIPASGHIAKFIDEIFSSLTTPFSGVLRITSISKEIAVVGLRARINQRGDFLITTTPPANESEASNSTTLFFPHFADAGGWTTQFILFSGQAGQSSQGYLRFVSQEGEVIDLLDIE